MRALELLVSHHRPAQHYRCVVLRAGRRRLHVCARCLGLYPTLLGVMALQIGFGIPAAGRLDWWIALGGAAPALLDWGLGQLGHRGRNWVRVLTGALLGVALGRSLVLYFRDPTSEVFWVQLALLTFAALAFTFVGRLQLSRL